MLLLNDDRHGAEVLACTLQALTYDADALFPVEGAAAVRKQAAFTLGKLKALHHRRDVPRWRRHRRRMCNAERT